MRQFAVASLHRHPIKSVGGERLESAELAPGAGFPGDRVFAVAHGRSAFDPGDPAWTPCKEFLRIANAPQLAAVRLTYDPTSTRVRAEAPAGAALLCAAGHEASIEVVLADPAGRAAFAAWLSPLAQDRQPPPFQIVGAPGVAMTDSPEQAISVMSLASLQALSEAVGAPLDRRRLRGNVWIEGEGLEAWAEERWVGRSLTIGAASLEVIEPIHRCLATAADPESGARSANPLPALRDRGEGDAVFGVLARVVRGGPVAVGDAGAVA